MSETLGESVRLRVTTHALRTIEHKGGLDNFLLAARDAGLTPELRRLKRRIRRATQAAGEAEATSAASPA